MRIVLAGQKAFGAAIYQTIAAAGHEIVLVCAPEHGGTATDGTPMPDRLRACAEADRIPWLCAGTLRSHHVPPAIDLIVAAHSHDFISRATRLRTRLGAIGYHPSLLPMHRGRDAVRWTVRMRERIAGGSVYWLNDVVDGGDIAAQDFCFVRADDTAHTLWRRELFPLGVRLIAQTLRDLSAGRLVRVPQDEALATWEPALDAPPLARPELPMIGTLPGFTVERSRASRA